jgi:hypothetical protein
MQKRIQTLAAPNRQRSARSNLNPLEHGLAKDRPYELEQLCVHGRDVSAVRVGVQLRGGIAQKKTEIFVECALSECRQKLFENAAGVDASFGEA